MSIRKLGSVATTAVLALLLAPLSLTSPAHAEDTSRSASRAGARVESLDLPHLQMEAAKLQAGFVRASLELEQARLELAAAQGEVADAEVRAERAQATADRESQNLATYVDTLYTQGPSMDSGLMVLVTGLTHDDTMWRENLVFEQVTSDQATVVERAQIARSAAIALQAEAEKRQEEADKAEAKVQAVLIDISERADQVTAAAEDSFQDNSQEAEFNDVQQSARNKAAGSLWRGYQRRLREDHVKLPSAKALRDPRHLPPGLVALTGKHKARIPGVALSADNRALTVLPRPVVTAVTSSLAELAKPYVAGGLGPESYDCGGLVAAAYPGRGSTPADLFEHTRPVPRDTVQVGDLVFFATEGAGIHHVGIYLGGELMIAADGPASQVAVLPLPEKPYAVTRPSLPVGKAHDAPTGDGTEQMTCGSQLIAGGVTTAGMVSPVAPGEFTFSSRFGEPGVHWGSGFHTGLDFAAPVGTPVVAAREGTVSISHPDWAGNLVTVDHGNGLTTTYAHLSSVFVKPGQEVLAGQSIGAVGQLGNTTGPHLHFEVVILGTPVDPELFLGGGGPEGSAGWGGFLNGMIPTTELCGLESAPGQLLRCDAARAYDALARAYRGQFGSEMCITDSYRTFASQVTTFANKPGLAAVPGTSNHGWALAVDLCGGIEDPASAEHAWLQSTAPAFGWTHPEWAEPGGGRPEPWHWEFGNIS
ncbi:peptidoglycan DD-metalloendopeptidase family protein [Nocardioides sp.]|uniref:peptidoglycan DD-metalloendopeptidase family protein n=1 Tax=Nocardioides sp. TaxID=35761 RepID=UPI003D0B1D32